MKRLTGGIKCVLDLWHAVLRFQKFGRVPAYSRQQLQKLITIIYCASSVPFEAQAFTSDVNAVIH